ncbi:MAG: class I SAM-dependent methyltransferase [Vicinamibacterales bacterium]
MRLASGVVNARVLGALSTCRSASSVPYNAMFRRDLLPHLEAERRELQRFDLYLFDIMNSVRLRGEKVFEYGTLLHGIPDWRGLRVLDVGSGRSTLPQWMTYRGASVTSVDLPTPAEDRIGGFQVRVNDRITRQSTPIVRVAGSMRSLPIADASVDVITSLSVVEHLDTEWPGAVYVPYGEQRKRLAEVMEEAIRVTKPGGYFYLTSECCDYDRATTDAWRSSYYYTSGPDLSAAWPVRDVPALFYQFVADRGCTLVGGVQFDPADISDAGRWSFRGPYFSGFSMLARKDVR